MGQLDVEARGERRSRLSVPLVSMLVPGAGRALLVATRPAQIGGEGLRIVARERHAEAATRGEGHLIGCLCHRIITSFLGRRLPPSIMDLIGKAACLAFP